MGETDNGCRWRKGRDGDWVVFGPATAITSGKYVEVKARSGDSRDVFIEKVSRSFQVDGVAHVFGYLPKPTCELCGGANAREYGCEDGCGPFGFCEDHFDEGGTHAICGKCAKPKRIRKPIGSGSTVNFSPEVAA